MTKSSREQFSKLQPPRREQYPRWRDLPLPGNTAWKQEMAKRFLTSERAYRFKVREQERLMIEKEIEFQKREYGKSSLESINPAFTRIMTKIDLKPVFRGDHPQVEAEETFRFNGQEYILKFQFKRVAGTSDYGMRIYVVSNDLAEIQKQDSKVKRVLTGFGVNGIVGVYDIAIYTTGFSQTSPRDFSFQFSEVVREQRWRDAQELSENQKKANQIVFGGVGSSLLAMSNEIVRGVVAQVPFKVGTVTGEATDTAYNIDTRNDDNKTNVTTQIFEYLGFQQKPNTKTLEKTFVKLSD